ncbi:MAG: AMP-dependent synthetase/ligase [Opitutales bacterium]
MAPSHPELSGHRPTIARTLAHVYVENGSRFADRPAFATRDKHGHYASITYADLLERGRNLATALIELGVRHRDHVAILADNRLEWILADYGTLLAGAADVPRGTDVTDQEIVYILTHADTLTVFVEDEAMMERVRRNSDRLPDMIQVILMDPAGQPAEGVLPMQNLIERGATLRAEGDRKVEERLERLRSDDLFTLIYTSGTTGKPKGVQLTHANMLSQIRNVPLILRPDDRILSVLPIWHSYERVFEMLAIANGCCTYYTTIRTIGDDLKTVRPTIMGSAPRLWESLHGKILQNVEKAPPVRQTLFKAAYFCARMVMGSWYFFTGKKLRVSPPVPAQTAMHAIGHSLRLLLFLLPWLLLDKVVLSKLRGVVGGELRCTVSGGGALPSYVDEFFNYIGIPVLEGFGMTETTPVTAVRTFDKLVIGTVGPVIPETEVRIIDLDTDDTLYPNRELPGDGRGRRGEILFRGPQVMKGYYKDPETTAKVLQDGFMRTGDIGMITYNDCLKILGRCKDIIVLLSGENIEPNPIEAKICESPLVDHCMLVGQDEKHLGALVVPAVEALKAAGIEADSHEAMAEHPEAHRQVQQAVRSMVTTENGFKAYEKVPVVALVPKPFEPGGEMTHTFKLKRHIITDRYHHLIEQLFSHSHRNKGERVGKKPASGR